jgi:hypothetical protein
LASMCFMVPAGISLIFATSISFHVFLKVSRLGILVMLIAFSCELVVMGGKTPLPQGAFVYSSD